MMAEVLGGLDQAAKSAICGIVQYPDFWPTIPVIAETQPAHGSSFRRTCGGAAKRPKCHESTVRLALLRGSASRFARYTHRRTPRTLTTTFSASRIVSMDTNGFSYAPLSTSTDVFAGGVRALFSFVWPTQRMRLGLRFPPPPRRRESSYSVSTADEGLPGGNASAAKEASSPLQAAMRYAWGASAKLSDQSASVARFD